MRRKRSLKYDLTGKIFGKLEVTGLSKVRLSNRITWDCICECGKKTKVLSQSLRDGSTKSCGCGVGEDTHKRQLKPIRTGRRFGKLKVLGFSHQDKQGNMRFECQCDCGNIHVTKGSYLRSGKTRSCGCGQLESVTKHGLSYTPEYYKAATYKRRNAIRRNGKGNGSSFTATDLKEILARQKNRCFYCRAELDGYHVEHKTPISRGGTHSKENICASCLGCNLRKGRKTAEEFLKEQ